MPSTLNGFIMFNQVMYSEAARHETYLAILEKELENNSLIKSILSPPSRGIYTDGSILLIFETLVRQNSK